MFYTLLLLLSPGIGAEGCDESTWTTDLQQVLERPASPTTISALNPGAFESQGLRAEVFSLALKAYQAAVARGETSKSILTVIDYSLPSDQKRLWVIDLESARLLFHEYVSHGKGSGTKNSTRFSNVPQSKTSNIGLMKTAETYWGQHGYSLKLDGLEDGFNDNARSRAIVIHAASYATEDFARRNGRLGLSWGCPALDPAVSTALIDTIKSGSLVFGYAPQEDWLNTSVYLR